MLHLFSKKLKHQKHLIIFLFITDGTDGTKKNHDTVDGRNPAPADMVNIPLFTGFDTSQVVQDFFHQQ